MNVPMLDITEISMVKLKKGRIGDIEKIFKDRRVYGYGAGKYLDNFCVRNADIFIEKYLHKLVAKDTGIKKIANTCLEVISLDELKRTVQQKDIILLTTSGYYVDIISELDSCLEFDGIEVYILTFMENDYGCQSIDWELYGKCRQEKEVIPRIIHYCWFGKKEIPQRLKSYMQSWKKYCPDYEIVCWSEDNYDIAKNRYVSEAYKCGKWAFVSDYVRLDVINEYGGIYLDTDVELVKPLDELLHFNGFIGFETQTLVATGLGFGSKKDNIVLQKILEYYQRIQEQEGKLDFKPCPFVETDVLIGCGLKKNNRLQKLEDDFLVLPTSFLGGMNLGTRKIEISENTYSIHHYSGTWLGDKQGLASKREEASNALISRMS